MGLWGAILKTLRLCVCLLLLSMLVLVYHTLREQEVGPTTQGGGQLPLSELQLSEGPEQQWREWRRQRVLASSTSLEQTERESSTHEREIVSTPSVARKPKPLPHFNLESLLEMSNDSAFLPRPSNHTHLPTERHAHSHPPSDEVLSPRSPGGGYVVVMRVYEQQTMASGNLLQLQCWSSMLNMSLVAPFMKFSQMVTPLDEARQSSHLSLWDVFSHTHWETHTRAHGYLPLVEWRQWVKQAPRKLIAVQFKYPLLSQVKNRERELGVDFPHPLSGEDYTRGCEFRFLSGKARQFLKNKKFDVVRKVCFNFLNGDGFTFSEFRAHLFGRYQPGEVSVMVDMWRGLGEPQRVLITDKICREQHPFREQVQPSPRLLDDAQSYKDQFLGPEDYLAVITRFEMTGLSRQYELDNDTHAEIPRCIRKTLYQLQQLRKDTGIENTFVSTDIGKYGSSSFAKKKYYHHYQDMVEFVRAANRGKMVMGDIERTLEKVSGTTDSGYIASLQQLIVTRARCVLFMGGGSFQRHALHMYQDMHPRKEDQCIHVVQSCTNPNRPIR